LKTQIIFAGHGGQGVLELANNVSYFELLKGNHVAYTPSYGPESRGGKVKCYVVISDEQIDSPIVEEPDYLFVMNIPSMDFVGLLKSGGTLFMNSSLIPEEPSRGDIRTFKIPATEIADSLRDTEIGAHIPDTKIAANSVMFGAYLGMMEENLNEDLVRAVFKHFLLDRKETFIPLNMDAAKRGYEHFVSMNLVSPRFFD
jgi:2-oxoglutarate ferredoxin oxidoreductase subunit gamma